MSDNVLEGWNRDNCKTDPVRSDLLGRTRNILQILIGTGDGWSRVVVRGFTRGP